MIEVATGCGSHNQQHRPPTGQQQASASMNVATTSQSQAPHTITGATLTSAASSTSEHVAQSCSMKTAALMSPEEPLAPDASPGINSNTNSSSSWSLSRRNGNQQKLSVVLPQKVDPKLAPLASLATPTIVCANEQGQVASTSLWGSLVQLNGGQDIGRFTGLPSCTPTDADCISNPFFWNVAQAHTFAGGNCDESLENRVPSTGSNHNTERLEDRVTHQQIQSQLQVNGGANSSHDSYKRRQELAKLSFDQNQVTLLSPFPFILSPEQEAWIRLTQHPLAAAAEHQMHQQHQQMLNTYHNTHRHHIYQQQQQQHHQQQQQQPQNEFSAMSQQRKRPNAGPQDLTKQQQHLNHQHHDQQQIPEVSINEQLVTDQQILRRQQSHHHPAPYFDKQMISSQYLNAPSNHRHPLNYNLPFTYNQVVGPNNTLQARVMAGNVAHDQAMIEQQGGNMLFIDQQCRGPQLITEKSGANVLVTNGNAIPVQAQNPPIAHHNQVQQHFSAAPIESVATNGQVSSHALEGNPVTNRLAYRIDSHNVTKHPLSQRSNTDAQTRTNGLIDHNCEAKEAPQVISTNPAGHESSSNLSLMAHSSTSGHSSQSSSPRSQIGSVRDRVQSQKSDLQIIDNRSPPASLLASKSCSNLVIDHQSPDADQQSKPKKKTKATESKTEDTTGLITITGDPLQPTKKKSKGGRKKKLITHEEFIQRKNRSKERNRVAAKRCRQKRKQLLDELHDQADELRAQNSELQKENLRLRNELESIKLHHTKCNMELTD